MRITAWNSVRAALVGASVCCAPARGQSLSVTYRNSVALPSSAVDQHGAPFTITGLSGISYRGPDASGAHRFLAVMDNSSRLVDLALTISADGTITGASVVAGFSVAESRDFEDVVALPLAAFSVLLAEEDTPGLREYSLASGAFIGGAPTPAVYLSRRANFGFECVARSRDGSEWWTANEEALAVDGPLSTPGAGTLVRLQRYTVAGDAPTPAHQFAYLTAPVHGPMISGSRSGVSALTLLPDGTLLTLERSLAGTFPIPSFQSRIYAVLTAGATDVSAVSSLTGPGIIAAGKTLLYQGNHANMEGLCLGPALASGAWSLAGIVDDGDHLLSTNRVVGFALTGLAADPPCGADYNGDGFVNGDDFDRFTERFDAGDGSADVDLNGFVNGDDFDVFSTHFTAGC